MPAAESSPPLIEKHTIDIAPVRLNRKIKFIFTDGVF